MNAPDRCTDISVAQLRAAALAERRAVAADVHDGIGQQLAFVRLRLPLLQDAVEAGAKADAQRYCAEVRETIEQAHTSLRALLRQLRAAPESAGLARSLQSCAEAFRARCGTTLELSNAWPQLRLLSPEHEAQAVLIVQEALTNIARHARAGHAWLALAPAPGGGVHISVQDDGCGPGEHATGAADAAGAAPDAAKGVDHHGLAIMRERANRLGGTLELCSREGGGTCLTLKLSAELARPEGA